MGSARSREVAQPRRFLKLCGTRDALAAVLPGKWRIQPRRHFMIAAADPFPARPLPDGYRMETHRKGPIMTARILAWDGTLAAGGHAAQAAGAFIYDRIETHPAHRRRGLGHAVMNALRVEKIGNPPELLVATDDGRALYSSLGWRILSPYSTAVISD